MDSFGFNLTDSIVVIILAMCFGLFFGFLFDFIAEMLFKRFRNKKLSNF